MTDQTETNTTAEATITEAQTETNGEETGPEETPPEPKEDQHSDPALSKARKEAARYRTELRDVQGQLEAAQEALKAAHMRTIMSEIDEFASGRALRFIAKDALPDVIDNPSEYMNADGSVDWKKLDAALTPLMATKKYLFTASRGVIRGEGELPYDNALSFIDKTLESALFPRR